MTDERRSRDLELLKKAVNRDRPAAKREKKSKNVQSPIMYRGKPVAGGGSGGRTPGAPGTGRNKKPSSGAGVSNVKDALRSLTQLYNDGLITTAEYDTKRAEILDRL